MISSLLHDLYAAIAPWAALSLLFIGRNPHPGIRRRIASPLLATSLLFAVPPHGWNAAAWIRVLEPNPSLTLTGILLIALASRLSGQILFRRQDWSATWIFGAAAALLLYPMGLGLTHFDPYGWGWDRILPVATGAVALILILRGNRFGALLLLPFAGHIVGVQESSNFWDALLDPFYASASLLAVAAMGLRLVMRSGIPTHPNQNA
jgi:hypothetical protein